MKIKIKNLQRILPKRSGRDARGHVSVRHQGGRQKRFLRLIDFKRAKRGMGAKVEAIEYDPNRSANIALLVYPDGERRYILAPEGLKAEDTVEAGPLASLKPGNALPMSQIPVGTNVHNIEISPARGGQIIRSSGSFAIIQAKEGSLVVVRLPSGETRKFQADGYATIGAVGRVERGHLGKAGRKRLMGRRPHVRGVAMAPNAHPHGGGEGKSGEGMPPKTPWGKPARGVKTRKKQKYSDNWIVTRRRVGYGSK